MRFNKTLHWEEGLFLQQQHLQYLQHDLQNRIRASRSLEAPYSEGFIDLELDEEALDTNRINLKKVSAIFKSGLEISMPGNANVMSIDISSKLRDIKTAMMVYLAVPCFSDVNGNVCSDGNTSEKRIYVTDSTKVRDQNTGESETLVAVNRINVKLLTDLDDTSEYELLPLVRILPHSESIGSSVAKIDTDYIPPFWMNSESWPINPRLNELLILMRRRRDTLLSDMSSSSFMPEHMNGTVTHNMLQLMVLNKYIGIFSSTFEPEVSRIFDLFVSLKAFHGELSALYPMRDYSEIGNYEHYDCGKGFNELVLQIRSMLLSEGETTFIKLDFIPDGRMFKAKLDDASLIQAEEYYVALTSESDSTEVAKAVEEGDKIRLIPPTLIDKRVRGAKLVEVRYPPKYFPSLVNTVWFKIEREESTVVWNDIKSQQTIVFDWVHTMFPDLKINVYITLKHKKPGK